MNRCWSYSKAGRRCVEDAGHDGTHADRVTWTDEEAWAPTGDAPSNVVLVPVVDPPRMTENPARCFACNHVWHNDVCKFTKDELDCGCSKALA